VANVAPNDDAQTRSRIAPLVLALSGAGVLVLAVVALWLSTAAGRPRMAQLVFTSVLPLLGTWVGTVLAFYFARDNLQAAADTTVRLSAVRYTDPTSATDAMIPLEKIVAYVVPANSAPADAPLKDVANHLGPSRQRVPIFAASNAVLYVVHKSTLDSYATGLTAPDNVDQHKLGDILGIPDLRSAVEAIATVSQTATLDDARAAMRGVTACNDVFITSDGKRESPVIGWLTNTLLAGAH
jgi:hypothetical protein